MIYKRDYSKLTSAEQKKYDAANEYRHSKKASGLRTYDVQKFHKMMPDAGWHYESLFPNNYVFWNLRKHEDYKAVYKEFIDLIHDQHSTERQILNFIRGKEAYFIVESLFYYFDFGHHDAYLFKEFPLAPQYICDFLLIGKNSGGYEFVFIEFEHPYCDTILKDGEFGGAFRKGIKQAEDWDLWLESNFNSLKNVFNSYKSDNRDLPSEFYELDKSRLHFIVISGRREHFKSKTYRLKRKSRDHIRVIHYDNLIEVCDLYMKDK